MNIIINTIKFIDEASYQLLLRETSKTQGKSDLIEKIRKGKLNTEEEIYTYLSFKNKNSYYIFKHRFIDEIVKILSSMKDNEYYEVLQQSTKLRYFLYSNNFNILKNYVKNLEKKVEQLEVFQAKPEIALYHYLLNFNNKESRADYESSLAKAHSEYLYYTQIEALFFRTVFYSLDLYYCPVNFEKTAFDENVERCLKLHKKLRSNTSLFFYLSAYLTVMLHKDSDKNPAKLLKYLVKIQKVYKHPSVAFKYPDCEFAIECLYNKFYYLHRKEESFIASLDKLKSLVKGIRGIRMYENTYFYFLFINIQYLVDSVQLQKIPDFINEYVTESEFFWAGDKLKYYFRYLKALAFTYESKFNDAYSELLRARDYKNHLDEENVWIEVENVSLSLILLKLMGNAPYIDHEKKVLYKILRKGGVSTQYKKEVLKLVRHTLKPKGKELNRREKISLIFSLIDLDFLNKQIK